MSEYRPSKYIAHSDYASVKTYEPLTASVTLPDAITVYIDDVTYYVDIALPSTKGIGWRALVMSSKYDIGVNTPSFLVPCKRNEHGMDFDSFFYGEVLRISATTMRLRLVIDGSYDTATVSDCGQTFTIKLQPYLSPFDA